MSRATGDAEDRKVDAVARSYRRRGYRVTKTGQGSRLPAFLEGFTPDLIAEADNDKVVIEVKQSNLVQGANDLQPLAERVAREPGWRFELITVSVEDVSSLAGGFAAMAARARETMRAGFNGPAFLLAWAATETLLQDLAKHHRLQIARRHPAELARELASAGVISREQFNALSESYAVRNDIAHGVTREPTAEEVESLLGLGQSLRREIAAAA